MNILGVAGFSGSGKTTLIERLVPRLVAGGWRVSLLKHAHHAFDVDTPGKDSWRQRQAGCTEVLVSSGRRWALMHELRGAAESTLDDQLARLSPCDLVLVEGWKHARIPKLEVYRLAVGAPLLAPDDPDVIAIATDVQGLEAGVPCLPIDDIDAVALVALHVLGSVSATVAGIACVRAVA
ncbi:MAG: molybdopterin-guanine dinucleotide biosynthesis protein B [Proteobacteria bacterium]|nr:molybdopterin-guanine dinucleotide biosynthesis protein B [Burkholderiales bacterium]